MNRIRTYVKVKSVFDATGFMQPEKVIWNDGRIDKIEKVKDFRPASCIERGLPGDCYTVVINGENTHLFFQRSDDRFASTFGRWYVEEYDTT